MLNNFFWSIVAFLNSLYKSSSLHVSFTTLKENNKVLNLQRQNLLSLNESLRINDTVNSNDIEKQILCIPESELRDQKRADL